MTDAPEKIGAFETGIQPANGSAGVWMDKDSHGGNGTEYTRTDLSEAAERAAYLRGLEDAAKVAEELAGCVVTPSPKPVYTNGFVTGISDAVDAIRELAKEGGE